MPLEVDAYVWMQRTRHRLIRITSVERTLRLVRSIFLTIVVLSILLFRFGRLSTVIIVIIFTVHKECSIAMLGFWYSVSAVVKPRD